MKKLIPWLLMTTSVFAQALPTQTLPQQTQPQLPPKPQARVTTPANAQQEREFSSLAFSNPSNTSEEDSNINIKTQDHMGALMSKHLTVFGSNLFGSQCTKLHQARFFNPDYRITVGDQVNLQMWGAYQFAQALPVDTQGNIFIPEVGPVKIEGVENKSLNEVIKRHVKKIFSKDVHVYADLVTAQPVQVYVTGFVNSPGLYDGLSSDSVIYFLCAAGGINLKEGSFRKVDVIRHGNLLHKIDLYDFILHGNINQFQLHQGDTIVVKAQRYPVSVDGDVKNPYQYEWSSPRIPIKELIRLANVEPSVTFVRIQRNQGAKPEILYKRMNDAQGLNLKAGDRVTFVADKEVNQILITLKGQIKGRHQYVVPKGTTLASLVNKIHMAPNANVKNLQLYRESVAKQQREAIHSSLSRMEKQIMTSSSVTDSGAKLQAAQSEMVMKFINEAKNVELKGQVVLGEKNQWDRVILENNDVVNVPQETSVVTVSGDVVNALSLEANPRYSINDYLIAAGGMDRTANMNELLVIKQNGTVNVVRRSGWTRRSRQVEGGDQIIVLPKVSTEGWQLTESMSKILYQVAIAARVALAI